MKISDFDKNMLVDHGIDYDDVDYYDVLCDPVRVYGVEHTDGMFRRLPKAVAESVSPGVAFLSENTAGGRIRFTTDSPYIVIHAEMPFLDKMSHFAMTGSCSFDIYGDNMFFNVFHAEVDFRDTLDSIERIPEPAKRDYILNMPTYSSVSSMMIGIKKGYTIEKSPGYRITKPIVYYGSSITQGACCSHPGTTYQSIISRYLDCDYINLGFSGSAKGEDAIAEYISGLDMSVFVYDYDHNAPDPEHLEKTHEKMFRTIREKNPDLPVIMMSRPKYHLTDEEKTRLGIVRRTYEHARDSGDRNVYFIPGDTIFSPFLREVSLEDDSHPTDNGFACMAYRLLKIMNGIDAVSNGIDPGTLI